MQRILLVTHWETLEALLEPEKSSRPSDAPRATRCGYWTFLRPDAAFESPVERVSLQKCAPDTRSVTVRETGRPRSFQLHRLRQDCSVRPHLTSNWLLECNDE